MRALTGIFLITLFLYQIIGIQFVYSYKQNAIRKEIKKRIKEGVDANDLHYIQYSDQNKKDFVWIKKKEFKYQGKLYDVVFKKVNSDGIVTFECIDDTQEALLFKSLDDLVNGNLNTKGLTKLLKLGFEITSINYPISINQFELSDTNNKNEYYYLTSTYYTNIGIDTPPPQQFM